MITFYFILSLIFLPFSVCFSGMQGQRDYLRHVRVNRSLYASVALAVWMIEAEPPLQRRFNNHKGHPAEEAAKSQYRPLNVRQLRQVKRIVG